MGNKPRGYWTYEKCKEEALKYNSRTEWYVGSKGSYKRAMKNCWLDELCSHMIDKKKHSGYWTYEKCKEEALKYTTISKFQSGSKVAYMKCYKNGWIDKICSHMIVKIKHRGYWTYEKCKEESLKYESRKELRIKNKGVYYAIKNNKWWELLEHMDRLCNTQNYWTYEKCKEEVSKYETIKDFRSSKAYQIILKNKWGELLDTLEYELTPERNIKYDEIKKITLEYNSYKKFIEEKNSVYWIIMRRGWLELLKHLKRVGNFKRRLIYAYEFSDNSVYVGLTYNIDKRDSSHKRNVKSSVYKHMEKTKLIPKLVLISDYIEEDKAVLLEGSTLEEYRSNGWVIINKSKTGGLGSTSKWTYRACVEEVKLHKTIKSLKESSNGCYHSIIRNKWNVILDSLSN